MNRNTRLALDLLRSNGELEDNARQFAGINNSIVGSELTLQYQIPRRVAESAVRAALAILDDEDEGDACGEGAPSLKGF